jgi:DNA-directed RNA polymerase subunit RPC12/RpoP
MDGSVELAARRQHPREVPPSKALLRRRMMALVKCPECSREVADRAESCPNCGIRVLDHPAIRETHEVKYTRELTDREVIAKMTTAGWEYKGAGRRDPPYSTLLFRRRRGSSTESPPVGRFADEGCMLVLMVVGFLGFKAMKILSKIS